MSDKLYIDIQENEHLEKSVIKDKEQYYYDLDNIEASITGRADASISNTFIYEAKYLIVNAIKLFEMGYFDCAYYSLREAIEFATIMIYLVDVPEKKRKKELSRWINIKSFKRRAEMLEILKEKGNVFRDFKEKLNDFFEDSRKYINDINKFVHKQGEENLHTTRKFYRYKNKLKEDYYLKKFDKYLKFTIGYVAVMRLSIDPFPILLMDEEIYRKTGDLMTEPYTTNFINKYIDEKYVKEYKDTDIYIGYSKYFSKFEGKNETILNIVKNEFVDMDKYDDILKQWHLLNNYEKVIVNILRISEKVTDVYRYKGILQYFSNRDSNRTKYGFDSREFEELFVGKEKTNIDYSGVYISLFIIENEEFYALHNEKFDKNEIEKILEVNSQKME